MPPKRPDPDDDADVGQDDEQDPKDNSPRTASGKRASTQLMAIAQ